jgi:hypothetical protein
MSPFSGWENFYIIIGPSAGALTGLTFVAVTLAAETRRRGAGQGIAAFNTPTIVQFGLVLFVSAVLSAPWPELVQPAFVLGLCGFAGVIYTMIVTQRLRSFNEYEPVLEDWLWNSASPLVAYSALAVAAVLLRVNPAVALFVVAAVMLLLLFTGIHNAWDVVTFIAIQTVSQKDEGDETKE